MEYYHHKLENDVNNWLFTQYENQKGKIFLFNEQLVNKNPNTSICYFLENQLYIFFLYQLEQCYFYHIRNHEYCHRHLQKLFSIHRLTNDNNCFSIAQYYYF